MNASTPSADVAMLLCSSYWLVSGLERDSEGLAAEAAVALPPAPIPRGAASHGSSQIFGCVDLYAAKRRLGVVFFLDLTWIFTQAGTSWTQLGADHQSAVGELHGGFPAMFLTMTERLCQGRQPARSRSPRDG